MPKHSDVFESPIKKHEGLAALKSPVQPEVPEDVPPTDPIVTPDTPPMEANPIEPAPTPDPETTDPTPVPETDSDTEVGSDLVPVPDPEPVKEAKPHPDKKPVVEPSPQPPAKERPVHKGDKPIESIPVGSAGERAVTYASRIEDEGARTLLLQALADQKVYSKDEDLRYRMQVADSLREMIRWIRTNVPSSASYKNFMEGVNTYLVMVESHGIPSMWSEESANAPLDEIQARKAAMAIERAVEHMVMSEDDESEEPEEREKTKKAHKELSSKLKGYAQKVREGKIK